MIEHAALHLGRARDLEASEAGQLVVEDAEAGIEGAKRIVAGGIEPLDALLSPLMEDVLKQPKA